MGQCTQRRGRDVGEEMSRQRVQPDRSTVRPEELEAYDRVVARQASYGYGQASSFAYDHRPPAEITGPYFGALLASPWIADHISELGVIYRTRGEFPGSYAHKDREWIDIVVGLEMGFNMWGHHADGMAVGVEPLDVIALHEGRDWDLSPELQPLTAYIRAVVRGQVTDEQYAVVEERFGERGAVEYTEFIGHLVMTIRLVQVYTSNVSLTSKEVIEKVHQVIRGEAELPDPRARIPTLTLQ